MATPLARTKLSQQIFDAVIDYIVTEGLAPGDSLPSTAALCEQFGTSRPVVREALSALEAVGLVEVHSGRNAVVRELDGHLIQMFLARALQHQDSPLVAMMEVRAPLEIQAARLAATRAQKADVDRLDQLVLQMDRALDDTEGYPKLDIAFHTEIARCTNNRALLWFSESLRWQLTEVMVKVRQHRESHGLVGNEQDDHRRIAEAIRKGDAEGAAAAMEQHMRVSEKYVQTVEGTREQPERATVNQ